MVRKIYPAALCALALALAVPPVVQAKESAMPTIKCWTEKDGTRECGNVVPPQYSQQQTTTVNAQGIVTGVSAAAKSKQEIEKEQAEKAAAAKRTAAEKQQQEKQAAYDNVLLSTFTTENDLIRSRDRKLSALDAQIDITNATVGDLQKKLDGLQDRAAAYERNGRPISDDLKSDMTSVKQQIAEKQKYIAYVQQQKTQVTEQYAAYLKRYRELKSGAAQQPVATQPSP